METSSANAIISPTDQAIYWSGSWWNVAFHLSQHYLDYAQLPGDQIEMARQSLRREIEQLFKAKNIENYHIEETISDEMGGKTIHWRCYECPSFKEIYLLKRTRTVHLFDQSSGERAYQLRALMYRGQRAYGEVFNDILYISPVQ